GSISLSIPPGIQTIKVLSLPPGIQTIKVLSHYPSPQVSRPVWFYLSSPGIQTIEVLSLYLSSPGIQTIEVLSLYLSSPGIQTIEVLSLYLSSPGIQTIEVLSHYLSPQVSRPVWLYLSSPGIQTIEVLSLYLSSPGIQTIEVLSLYLSSPGIQTIEVLSLYLSSPGIQTIEVLSYCSDVVCSEHVIVSGHYDRKIRFWDSRAASCTQEVPLQGKVTSLDISTDHRQLLSCSRDESLQVVDLRMNSSRICFRAEGFKCGCDSTKAIFSPDGSYLAAGSADGAVYIWNVNSGNLETRLPDMHSSSINAVAWSGSGEYVVSVDKSRRAVLWSGI
uniref:Anaphase-promoting complex subunit 4 WD40 domain-containing protein n=1 Tax=Oncorhynchus mykiss TaxID=8022 RepID=A0A8K9WP62_ONCMY